MKNSLIPSVCLGIAAIFASMSASEAQQFPPKITGGFTGIQYTSAPNGDGESVPTILSVSRGAKNLRIVSFQIVNGQHIVTQTVLRSNRTADTYTAVDGIVVQSGSGRYSRRGRTLTANFGMENAFTTFALRQRLTMRGRRVSLQQIAPQFAVQSSLLGNRFTK